MEKANQVEEKIDEKVLKELFRKSADVRMQKYTFYNHSVLFITCNAMVNEQLLNEVIIERVKLFLQTVEEPFEEAVNSNLHIPDIKKMQQKNEIIMSVYTGHVVLYFEDYEMIYASNITDKPNRNPEETKTEIPVKGPRDNFIEEIETNIALVRKRLPTNSLCVEKFMVGRRTKTTVALLYFDDIVNHEILKGIKEKINQIDVDIIFSGEVLMEYIDKKSRLFPRHDYSGRPDFAVQALARGRITILVDGVAYATITPVNFFLLFKSGEDHEYPSLFSSFERLLRVLGIIIGTFLPAFWLALISFHQNQLPFQLLATVVQASTGLPFPAALEMLLMLIMFELFREAGLRLPEVIGGTLSVVGGLIIGDAAIRAGITSPAMLVVIAVSIIATFTVFNQSIASAISLIRISSIIFTALFGLFGFFMSLYFTIMLLANIRIFGIPYLSVAEDLNWNTIKRTFGRLPAQEYIKRPSTLQTTDTTRQKNEDKK